MTHDDLDISGTPIGERFAAIRDTVARDAGVRMLERVRSERFRSDGKNRGYSGSSLRRWVGYGVLPLLGFISWQVYQSKFNKPASALYEYTTYTTKSGQRASLTLADGSRVTIGPLTTLRVQRGAVPSDGVSAEVNGEALFNVVHVGKRPFTVLAQGVTTRVLGTEFVVRAYDASFVRVAVRDGRVSVQSPIFTSTNAAIVNAGEAISATPNALPVVTPIADIATDFDWANGRLVLRGVPLGEALVRLSRWYGMEFRVTSPDLLEKTIGAAFPSAFSLADIKWLGTAIKADVTRSGNIVTFSKTP